MRHLNNERGIALVTSLLLTLISLAIVMAVIYMVTIGTQVSGIQKRYKSSLEASYGGTEIFTNIVIQKSFYDPLHEPDLLVTKAFNDYMGCFQTKLKYPRSEWLTGGCTAAELSLVPSDTPDVTFTLNGATPSQPNYTVFAKIVDTSEGNTDTSGIDYIDTGTGVAYNSPGVSPPHITYLYRIEVQGQKQTDTKEKANLSVLYAF